ncbi:MAG: hypothetical protein RLZZ262_203 [Bacteroidota bacterium]|jgi:four helix bundle protein
MATIKTFEDLEIWQDSRVLAKEVYRIVSHPNASIEFSLRNQIIRSSGSVMDNIAEGFERNGNREFKQFLSIAKGSCGEVKSQLYRLLDQNSISNEDFTNLSDKCVSLSKRIFSFMNYLNETTNRGVKFNKTQA